MKRPNPTFLKKAEGIKTSRKKRTLIIILVLLVITFIITFISSIASAQDNYRLMFPNLVGAATSTTTEYSKYQRPVHTTTETTTEVTTTATTTVPHAVLAATPTPLPETLETAQGSQNNAPDMFYENSYFSFKQQEVQTATYQERAVGLEDLKEKVVSYQKNHPEMRVCFEFVSLSTGERLGVDELDPVLPSGAMAIPFEIVYYDKTAMSSTALSEVLTYDSNYKGSRNSSYIAKNYSYGKQFYMRTILNYAVAKNDSIALNYVIDSLGGMDAAIESVNEISGYIPYNESRIYKDYQNKEHRIQGTISCYDMGNYFSYMYKGFINNNLTYQRLINDMAANEVDSPLKAAFPADARILHVLGRNTEKNAYMECAVIDYKEPIALIIYVEASSPDAAGTAIATLGGYTQKFIEACYKP